MNNINKNNLNQNDILIAEYNFAAQSAFQSNEDRIKVFSYFLANVGTFIAAIALPIIANNVNYYLFSGIFLLLFIIGVLTYLQLIKVRKAWFESVLAMNKIKDYYINNIEGLSEAFKWRGDNIPIPEKRFTIAYLLGLATIILNSISLASFFFLFIYQYSNIINIAATIAIATIAFIIQNIIWFKVLKTR